MFGSQCTFFKQDARILLLKRRDVSRVLLAKGYDVHQASTYLEAYDYFCVKTTDYDGATIVKDLCDIYGLDLDAMLHDYQYIVCNAGANFVTKFKADWIYAKGMERKGKSQYSAFGRLVGLTIVGLFIVPFKSKKANKEEIQKDYKILIK